jgi:serine/threonine-protein kinase
MLKEGTVLDGKYEVLKKIGEGGMSIVYLGRNNRLNMQLAVKEIKNDGSKSTSILL